MKEKMFKQLKWQQLIFYLEIPHYINMEILIIQKFNCKAEDAAKFSF